jgi:signal transduction histidine kinase
MQFLNTSKFLPFQGNLIIRVSVRKRPLRKRKEETVYLQRDDVATVTQIGTVIIAVVDDGVGMTKDQVKRVSVSSSRISTVASTSTSLLISHIYFISILRYSKMGLSSMPTNCKLAEVRD